MDRRLVLLLSVVLAGCTPVASSAGAAPTAASRSATPASVAGPAVCPITTPVTDERPKNGNTASFGRGWYVSSDRLLWASASGPFFVGENKVLWERPGAVVSISGKLLDGDAKAAGVPTITGPQGYEGYDYQASGVTFPSAGCWEVEARAETSVLDFVVFVSLRSSCPVTIAFQRPPDEVIDIARAGSIPQMSHDQALEAATRTNWVGTDGIWTPLPTDGVVTWGSATSGSKFPVWSLATGRVSATARRLDAPTLPGFTSNFGIPEVASSLGFIASGLTFPSDGCWKVTYRVGDAKLVFVVDVRR